MSALATEPGPLTTDEHLPSELLFGTNTDAARWVAFVGLGGRYASVRNKRRWLRFNGRAWEQCEAEDVNRAVRRALTTAYDRVLAERRHELRRLLDLNWQLGPLMWALRVELTTDPTALAMSPDAVEPHLSKQSTAGRVAAAMRRRCDECGLVAQPGSLGMHQKHTGHAGWAEEAA